MSERGQREREKRTAGQHALSFGLIPGEDYEESFVVREPGDALVVYSEGFFDTYPGGVALEAISDALGDAKSASPMVDRTIKRARLETIPRDDLTVKVLYCKP